MLKISSSSLKTIGEHIDWFSSIEKNRGKRVKMIFISHAQTITDEENYILSLVIPLYVTWSFVSIETRLISLKTFSIDVTANLSLSLELVPSEKRKDSSSYPLVLLLLLFSFFFFGLIFILFYLTAWWVKRSCSSGKSWSCQRMIENRNKRVCFYICTWIW